MDENFEFLEKLLNVYQQLNKEQKMESLNLLEIYQRTKNMMKQKIIILARDCDSTNIVYNYLKKYFEIDAIVFEKPIPRKKQF